MADREMAQDHRADISRMVGAYGDSLLRFCFLYLNDRHLAEDAVQETFLKAYQRLDSFRGDSSESTWLTAIALNCCRSLVRRSWFRLEDRKVSLDSLPEPSVPFDPQDDTVIEAVMALPPKYREVVLLHYYQGLSLREIAQMMSINEATVSSRVKRARAKLRDRLAGWYLDDEPSPRQDKGGCPA